MASDTPDRQAFHVACNFLARRPHSRMELKQKLARKLFSPEATEAALSRLEAEGFIKDEEVALRWAESLVRDRGWGPARIAAYLSRKGIHRDTAGRVLEEIRRAFSEADTAQRALEKRFPADRPIPSQSKAARFLMGRGFSSEVVYALVGKLPKGGANGEIQ